MFKVHIYVLFHKAYYKRWRRFLKNSLIDNTNQASQELTNHPYLMKHINFYQNKLAWRELVQKKREWKKEI